MKSAWIVSIMAILTSCNPGVDIDNIPADRLLYINGVISPGDSSLKVYVSRASGLSQQTPYSPLVEEKARVTISDGTRETTLQYNAGTEQYEGLNVFQDAAAGTRFILTATTPDDIKVVAQCVLPPKPKLITFKYDYNDNLLKYSLVWGNPEGYKYFQAWVAQEGIRTDGPGSTRFYKSTNNLLLEPEVYFWDRQPAGTNSITDSITIANDFVGPAKVNFVLANMEESIWKYKETSKNYNSWLSNAADAGIIPVFREPTQVYNNIEGGFGIFASYNSTATTKITIYPGN